MSRLLHPQMQVKDIVLPFLLVEGIVSKVSSVQKASISMVMKLAKGAGVAVRPHLPDLVCCMLECLSSLEDQRLNYVELHAANVGIQAEKLENLRIAVSKDSPMWETLDLCLKAVDAQSLELLVPRLAQLVRSGVGLNTRVGVAGFVTLLVQKVNADIKPFTSTLLKLLYHAVLEEKSVAAKRSFAAACAITLKYASPSQAHKLIEDTAALHQGDRNAQISCAILLKSYSNHAADIVSGYNVIIFPVTFISRFEDDKDISILFEELWEENTSVERVTLQLYVGEIVALICNCIASSSWGSKRKSAKAIRTLSDTLGESLSPLHHNLLKCLLEELPGRFWEGKDVILYAIASLCTSCHDAISAEDPTTPTVVISAISSACTKKVKSYREAAFTCLQQVIKDFNSPDFFNSVFPMLHAVCSQGAAVKPSNALPSSASMAIGEDSSEDVSTPLDKVLDCVKSCIHVARLQDILEQRDKLMHVLLCSQSPGFNWTVKTSGFSAVKVLCSKFDPVSDDMASFVQELFHLMAPKIVECIRSIKISQVHTAAAECLLEMTRLHEKTNFAQRKEVGFLDELTQLCEIEKSEEAKTLLKKCIVIIQDMKPDSTAMTLD